MRRWFPIAFTLAASWAAFLFLALPSSAQSICGNAVTILKNMKAKYREETVVTGVMAGGGLKFLVIASPAGTFTVLAVRPDGLACVIAIGEDLNISDWKKGEGL